MNEIILNYIVQAILGGASGYITNDYAINMLFKEYTPLKIGGVIKKTRQEFIENLSNLVENDIINKEKLQGILSNDSFKKEFEDLTVDFYENCLYEKLGNSTFADIDGFHSTIKSTDIFAAKIINEHMSDLYEIFLDNIDLSSFLTNEQLNTITNTLYSSLTNIINDTKIIEQLVLSIYNLNGNLSFNDLIDKNIYNTVIENSINILLKEPEKHKENINDILNELKINDALQSLKEVFCTKKIKDIINLDENKLNIINEKILEYVNSEKGNSLIYSLINSLFTYAKKSNKSINDLLNSSFKENLNKYLIENIPSLTENIVLWLKENSHLIDTLIEDSIDEVIKESDGLKAKLLATIKNSYFNNLSKKYSIADKIILYVKQIAEPEKLSLAISTKIIEMLNNLTVGEIILEAENNNITPDSTTTFIVNYINKNSKTLMNKSVEYISNIEVRKLVPEISTKKLNEFLPSTTLKNYVIETLKNNIDKILTKNLSSLISEKQTKAAAVKAKEFFNEKALANEPQLKEWLKQEIKNMAFDFTLEKLNDNTTKILNEEVFKYYKNATENLKNIPISKAIDKLNSIENLSKNSSESLRLYAVENTDVILSGSVKAIVTDNLNKLNDDELVELANDFIGRELKPIMYFGGILGVAAGLILALFQSSPLDPFEIKVSNMLVYSFVGYLTNVIAINMIFKPYKENKFLSKIPFLRNFSLGYIIKNQKTFAKNTAHFIDNSLLSKESINLLFDKYKDKIKNAFIQSISQNNYKTLLNLLANNKDSVIKSVFSFVKNKYKSFEVNSFIYNKLSKIKVSSFINEKAMNKITLLLIEKLHGPAINNKIYSLITSENTLESKISKSNLKKVIGNVEKNYYDKIISNNDELKVNILKYENKYDNYINNQINEILNDEKLENLANKAGYKLSNAVLDKNSREHLTNKGIEIINKSLDRNKTFEELFDGKFKNYIDLKSPILLEHMSSSITSNIKNSRLKITLMVQSEIKSNLGFIEKGMYTLMGGDEIIDELLTKIINEKIPKFMENKKSELQNIADTLLEEKFYKTKVDVLYTGLNNLQLNELVDNYLNKNNCDKIENKINSMTKDLFLKAGHLNLKDVLNLFNASSLEQILNNYKDEINAFTNELSLNLNNNKELVFEKMFNFTDYLIDDFMNVKFKEVFKDISTEDIKNANDKILAELTKNDLNKIIYTALEQIKSNLSINAAELINKNEFENSMEKYFTVVLESPEFEKEFQTQLESVINESLSVSFSFIDDKTKNYIINIFTDSCILSLKRNLDKILKFIEFDEIAREEIEKMEPEKIHEMFDSFGGKYFKRLMLYGFGGFVFGINMYVGFSLTILRILSELFNRNKRLQEN